jgi:hypothetical protein
LKKSLKVGLITAVAAVSMSVGAVADTALEEIKAYLNKGVSIELKGNAWTPKDEDGNVLHPITYNGSTYLPVRAVGEAVGLKVGWNAETQTVVLGEGQPAAPASGQSSRSNPAKIGTKVNVTADGFIDNYKATISVDETLRGDDAWKKVSAANPFNSKPKDGYEYLLAKISVKMDSVGKEGAKVDISRVNFTLVSGEGKDYETLIGVVIDPDIRTSLYEGASHTGWAVYQVKTDDLKPVITFGREYDGSGGAWFSTK